MSSPGTPGGMFAPPPVFDIEAAPVVAEPELPPVAEVSANSSNTGTVTEI
jgi:hypothetical protein